MDFEREVIRRLRDYKFKKIALENNLEKLKYLEDRFTSIKPVTYDSDPIKGGGTAQEDVFINNIFERDILKDNIKHCRVEIEEIDSALKYLDKKELELITSSFIDGLSVQNVCEKMYFEKSSYYKFRSQVIRKLALILYGRSRNE